MTIRLDMLRAMQRAQTLLHESAHRVVAFLENRLHETGGFVGRTDAPDLYYTLFGVESLISLGAFSTDQTLRGYLERFGAGDGLDLVHLCCLARLWADLPGGGLSEPVKSRLENHIMAYQSGDGGFNQDKRAEAGTVYAAFLALGALQDLESLKISPEALTRMIRSLNRLKNQDGSYNNVPGKTAGSVPVTAAALLLLQQTGTAIDPATVAWLRSTYQESGGFPAAPSLPMADLLSTATALHALNRSGLLLDDIRESCLDFVDRLWTAKGSFHAHDGAGTLDCEYTAYGLLALGNLREIPEP